MSHTDEPVMFETSRLFALRWSVSIAEQALEIYGDPKVTEFIAPMHCSTIQEMESKIEWIMERNRTKWDEPLGSFPVFLRATGQMVGTALIKNLPDGNDVLTPKIEIGWHLGHQFWGQGLATEFGNELLRIGFEELNLPVLYAVTGLTNIASQAVCGRLGMRATGRTKEFYGQELELFEMSKAEFQKRDSFRE